MSRTLPTRFMLHTDRFTCLAWLSTPYPTPHHSQPCPSGGHCQSGLLIPRSNYYSYNPWVPQIMPCPLKGACAGGQRSARGLPRQLVREPQRQTLGVPGPGGGAGLAPGGADAGEARRRQQRRLAQQDLAQPSAAAADQQRQRKGAQEQPQQQQQEQPVLSRRQALLGFDLTLAQLWTNDSSPGLPLLEGVSYAALLDAWHRLQCNPGALLLGAVCYPRHGLTWGGEGFQRSFNTHLCYPHMSPLSSLTQHCACQVTRACFVAAATSITLRGD
jgi:hypothetical protein